MELKLYLRMLLAKWWLIVAAVILTIVPTYLYVNNQPWVYQSSATFIIRPQAAAAADSSEFVRAVDTLSNRLSINTTFAEVASSTAIKNQAMEALGLSASERRNLSVSSQVIAGTNVLRITVQGLDPVVARDMAQAVSIETVEYVRNLYEVFELEPLDAAEQSNTPISPNKTLNIAVGAFLGLLLGVSLVFLLEYLKEPIEEDISFNIIDPETGVYNKSYLMLRLRQEMSRTWRNHYSLSVALIEISNRSLASGSSQQVPPAKASLQITSVLGSNTRDEDILAHLGDSIFALVLPDMPGKAAKDLLEDTRVKIGLRSPDEAGNENGLTMYSAIGITTYQNSDINEEELLMQAAEALNEATAATYGKVSLYSDQADGATSTPQVISGNELFGSERSLRKVVESRRVSN
jgi:diguanylate cyclase (GGDEF)-like protein